MTADKRAKRIFVEINTFKMSLKDYSQVCHLMK